MPALQQQSADVRFREIDLSQSIKSNSSSNAAIVLVSRKGRLTPYKVTTAQDFLAEYGEPDAAISFGHYCALDFLKEGSSLMVRRVVGTSHETSAVFMRDDGLGVTELVPVSAGLPDPANIDWDSYVSGAEIPLLMFYPKSGPGSYGDNIAIKITSQNIGTPAAPTVVSANTGGTLISATYRYAVAAISEIGETLASGITSIVIGGSVTTAMTTVTWTAVEGARGYYIYGRAASGTLYRMGMVGATTLSFIDDGSVTPDVAHAAITNPVNLPDPTPIFQVNVYDMALNSSTPVEVWECTLEDFTDGQGRQLEATQSITPFSDYINVASYVPQLTVAVPVVINVDREQMEGGDSGNAPTNGNIAAAWGDFVDPEQYNVNILINGGYTDVTVQQAMISTATTRGDAFAILDTPSASQSAQDAITYRQLILNANTSYAGIYTSDVLESDVYSGKKLYVPPSGWVSAVFARTDRVAGPQFAPAGLNRGLIDVLQIREKYNAQQRTDLFNAQVNYIRTFKGEGTSVFEQVTLQAKQSALSWVAVRRMINVIKASVRDFLMYSIHEPNDEFTRKQIVTATSDYLKYWKDARGILDYAVISDDSNNPATKYNLGILTVTIFITPVIAVHEIQVDVVITKAGLSFTEINIANLG
jgi:Phage tail sheath protein subtilisin-like domain/Phage tail sheath C-terminal domain